MKILVIQNKMIGDVLTSSILFEALRERYPEAELHYLIQPHTKPVVENNPFIDQLILFDPQKESTIALAKRVRREKYDFLIDIYAKINSALVTLLSRAKTRISIYKWYTNLSYTQTFHLKKRPDTNAGLAIENRLLLLKGLGKNFPVEIKPKIYLTENEKAEASEILSSAGLLFTNPLLMVSILGSSPNKTYPPPYMSKVLDFIVSRSDAHLLFNYIPKQLKEAEEIYNLCSPQTQKNIHFKVFGKNLREFMALTSHCEALIGNEGGAVNMAKALDVPTFSIFSPQINKETWSIYEDGIRNMSIHLRDFKPEVFGDLSKKEMVKKASEFYMLLEPKFIFAKLEKFLELNINNA